MAVAMSSATRSLATKLLSGDRQALARAITLVESSNETHRLQAEALLEHVARSGRSDNARAGAMKPPVRVGIAGPPGAGKSTLIEALGGMLTKAGLKVAVLTIDPSSHVTGGSILGDKSRMHELSRDPNAYVRPSPSRGVLGGLTRYTTDVVSFRAHAVASLITAAIWRSRIDRTHIPQALTPLFLSLRACLRCRWFRVLVSLLHVSTGAAVRERRLRCGGSGDGGAGPVRGQGRRRRGRGGARAAARGGRRAAGGQERNHGGESHESLLLLMLRLLVPI